MSKFPYSILFVEDELQIRKNYVEGLRLMFQTVYEADNGIEGYRCYLDKRPNIMIVDIDLPKLNGLELVKKIRDYDKNTKIIILTAHIDRKFLLEASSLKLVSYLVKPILRKDLNETLNLAISELQNYKIEYIDYVDLSHGVIWKKQEEELLHNNNKIALSPKEHAFLKLFFSSSKKVFTYEEIFEYVWGYEFEYSIDKIKSMVKKLRKKVPRDLIENIYSKGFKLNY